MSSTRLPGKIMAEIAGKPMLAHVYERVSRATLPKDVVVATTTEVADDVVEAYCQAHAIPVFRGSPFDVLDRYYQAASKMSADVVVRITADCPLIDPALLDRVVSGREVQNLDFACNRLPPPWHRTFPIGLDVETCTFASLERTWREARMAHQREHVMPYMYEEVELGPLHHDWQVGESTRGFRIGLLHHVVDCGALRWTVDTPEDLEFARQVYARLQDRGEFGWQDVLEVVEAEPRLAQINAGVRHNRLEDVDPRGPS